VEGVVIGKKLFQRAKKDKNAKVREKAAIEKLEKIHEKNETDLMECPAGKTVHPPERSCVGQREQ
jgi:hypothetical protein